LQENFQDATGLFSSLSEAVGLFNAYSYTKGLFGWAVAVKKVVVGCELWKKLS
jgi:hypothetical protein